MAGLYSARMELQAAPERRNVWFFVTALCAAVAARLVSATWLQPLQWDEIEFFRATDWISRGLVPYRDFWEHHTPLQWFVFAPFAAMTSSPGVAAIIAMRWAQVPFWVVAFLALNSWMKRAELSPESRWASIAFALCSSLFMIPALEYRIDTLGCVLYVAGLALAQRMHERRILAVAAGVMLCLAGLANIRLGPLLAVTVLLLRVVDVRTRRWANNVRAQWVWTGTAGMLAVAASWFVATGSWRQAYQYVWADNYLGDRYAAAVPHAFLHRILVPFGIRLIGEGPAFDPNAVDVGALSLLAIAVAGLVLVLREWKRPGDLFVIGVLQIVSVLFIAKMKFVYNYHFEIVVLMAVPLAAAALERVRNAPWVFVVAALAAFVAFYAALFRGKELDRKYQDVIMREADARTQPGEKVWDGAAWVLRRDPSYRFFFLPDLARQLVSHGQAAPYGAREAAGDPPALVITDRNALVWMSQHRDLAQFVTSHYMPAWRNLWVPAMSARLDASRPSAEWIAPRDGTYRIIASRDLANDAWFARPLFYASWYGAEEVRPPLDLASIPSNARVILEAAGRETVAPGFLALRRGTRVRVRSLDAAAVAVFAVPVRERLLFRRPLAGVTLEGNAPRLTHLPQFVITAAELEGVN